MHLKDFLTADFLTDGSVDRMISPRAGGAVERVHFSYAT